MEKFLKFFKLSKSSRKKRDTEPNIVNLPEDVLIEILEYLNYKELCTLGTTCKKFYALSKSPVLCSKVTVDIYKNREPMSETAMKVIKTLPKCITHLKLNFEEFDDSTLYAKDFLKILGKKAPNLRVLIFNRAKSGPRDISDSMVYFCEKIMLKIPVLLVNYCECNSTLKVYHKSIVKKSPEIEVTDAGLSEVEEEPEGMFCSVSISLIPILDRLCMAGLWQPDYRFKNDASRICHLIALDLERSSVTKYTYRDLQIFGYNLAELYVCHTSVGDEYITSYASDVQGRPVFPNLKILCLVGCSDLTYRGVDFLTDFCPSLQHVFVGPNDEHPKIYNPLENYSFCKSEKVRIVDVNDFCNHYAKTDYMNA